MGQGFGSEALHSVNRLAGAVAELGGAIHFGGAEKIVVVNGGGGGAGGDTDQIIKRDHGAGIGAHIVALDGVGRVAEIRASLHIDAIGTVVEVEVVHVFGGEQNLERIRNLLHGHVQGLRLLAVHVDYELGIGSGEAGENLRKLRLLVGLAHKVVDDVAELLERMSALVLDHELEAAEIAESVDRGGW